MFEESQMFYATKHLTHSWRKLEYPQIYSYLHLYVWTIRNLFKWQVWLKECLRLCYFIYGLNTKRWFLQELLNLLFTIWRFTQKKFPRGCLNWFCNCKTASAKTSIWPKYPVRDLSSLFVINIAHYFSWLVFFCHLRKRKTSNRDEKQRQK